MADLLPLRPGMERQDPAPVDTLVMASLAAFIETRGRRPIAAIVAWIDDNGEQYIGHINTERRDLAYTAAHLNKVATD